ncbi:MAG: sensor histidine kinase [Flavobacteriales bacterium]|nr:sensor histidine kinase [Flavobacteriales bacterium]MBP9079165.1 sensor histidine kinase [Flavobacteriales bacterium]
MTLRSPRAIALLVALCTALVAGAVLHLVPGGGAVQEVAVVLAVFLTAGAGTWWLVERYVQARVELIHRTVHEARGGRVDGAKRPVGLQEVDAEVAAWAGEKGKELVDLRERERFRREFIGNLAHELRTPAFSIQGYILTLLEGGLEDPKVNRIFLQRASDGTDRMIRIIEDLDVISNLESGVIAVKAGRMELKALVDEMIDGLRTRAAARAIRLHDGIQDEVWVLADHDRLAQVFQNLLGNAVHYGREGGNCTVQVFDIGKEVLVEVADDGPGIAAEHLPRLFERFYRVGQSRARNEGGSGLGLAIVKHLVEAHGGTIAVKSTEGEGTAFSFTLPKA